MMPKPNPNKRMDNKQASGFKGIASEKVLLETKPNFWLYSDNFILKIVVLFLMVFFFAPILTFVYTLHGKLVENFHIAIDNVMFYTELLLIILIAVVIIKIILDILDWNYTNYVLTDTRIVIQRGFIHKERIIMSYNKIQDIEITQSFLERLISVGDIIIYGANEVSETILDDIPSPKKVEEIILTCINNMGFANQNTYNNFQQPGYNQQYQQPNYQQQPIYQQQPNYQGQPNYQQQPIYQQQPNYQQQGYNQQYQQPNNQQQPNYEQQPNFEQQVNYNVAYPENDEYTNPDYNQNSYDEDCIQPEHNEYNDYNDDYEEDVITPERRDYERTEKTRNYSPELDKEQILRKHNQMFKRHKK